MSNILRAFLAAAAMALAAPAAGVSFGQVVDGVNASKKTKLQAQEFWKSVKGQEVSWSGAVVEVKGNSRKATLYLADKSRPLYKGFNIIVVTLDAEKAAAARKGQVVRFRGLLHKYSAKNPGAVIYLSDASLL